MLLRFKMHDLTKHNSETLNFVVTKCMFLFILKIFLLFLHYNVTYKKHETSKLSIFATKLINQTISTQKWSLDMSDQVPLQHLHYSKL